MISIILTGFKHDNTETGRALRVMEAGRGGGGGGSKRKRPTFHAQLILR